MGTYWNVSNETKKEFLDPGEIGGGGIKRFALECGDTAKIVAFLMMRDWRCDHVRFNADGGDGGLGDHYSLAMHTYRNITETAVASWNAEYPDDLIEYHLDMSPYAIEKRAQASSSAT